MTFNSDAKYKFKKFVFRVLYVLNSLLHYVTNKLVQTDH